MSYLKFKANQLFTGTQMLDASHVLITNEKGIVHEIIKQEDAGDDVRMLNGILCPGFINCHCHLELSHMKGLIPEHTGLVDFILSILKLRHFPEEEILQAIAAGEDEMLANGIVAVGDISNNALSFYQKSLGRLRYYNFIEVSGFHPNLAEPRFNKAEEVFNLFAKSGYAGNSAIVPHAPYSVSKELFAKVNNFSVNKLISIHNQETLAEAEFLQNGGGDFRRLYEKIGADISGYNPAGKASLQTWYPQLQQVGNLLLVHNTHTSEEDILFAQKTSSNNGQHLFWVVCINANQYIENALPPVPLLRQLKNTIIIGTDSLSSNHSLSILDELSSIHKHFPSIPFSELLQWATYNGATALQMEDTLGSFEKGKQPGILLLSEELDNVKRLL